MFLFIDYYQVLEYLLQCGDHMRTHEMSILDSTSALLRSSVFRTQPRLKVSAPATVALHESSHSP